MTLSALSHLKYALSGQIKYAMWFPNINTNAVFLVNIFILRFILEFNSILLKSNNAVFS